MKKLFYLFSLTYMFTLSFAFDSYLIEENGNELSKVLKIEKQLKDVFSYPFDCQKIDNKIFLIDTSTPAILKYDDEGNLLNLIDRKGKGPGELLGPVYMWAGKKSNELIVYDERRNEYLTYDYDLNFKKAKPKGVNFISRQFFYPNGSYTLRTDFQQVKNNVEFLHNIRYGDRILYKVKCHPFLMGKYHYKQPTFSQKEKGLYIAIQSREKYEIDYYEKGELLRKYVKKVQRVGIQENFEEEKELAEKRERFWKNKQNMIVEIPEEIYGYHQLIQGIDTNDNIWVLTCDNQGRKIDVISKNGNFQGYIRLKDEAKMDFFVINNNLITITGDNDIVTFRNYKIEMN